MILERRKVGDVATQRALDSVRNGANAASKLFDDARAIADVVLVDGVVKRIDHGLGRAFSGWLLVDILPASSASMTTGRLERAVLDGSDIPDETRQLWLLATGFTTDLTVRLVVF